MVNTISQQGVKLASQLLGLHSTVGGEDPDPSTSVLICFPWSHRRCPGEGEVRQCPVDVNALPNDQADTPSGGAVIGRSNHVAKLFNRPGVAGAVLQSPP